MPTFSYTVSQAGSRTTGLIEAESEAQAASELRQQGMMILSLTQTQAEAQRRSRGSGAPSPIASILISRSDLEATLSRLSALLAGGVPIVAALQALESQAPRALARVIAGIARRVRGGASLSKSFQAEAGFLGDTIIGLIGVGEANGIVAEMLQEASELMRRSREVKSRVFQAFTYPAIVTLGAIGVAAYIVYWVFPKVLKFINTQSSDVRLPAISRALIGISTFMTDYGLYVLLAPFGMVLAFHLVRKTEQGGYIIDRALLAVPLLGAALRANSNAMWTRTLGTLMRSGVDIANAIDLVEVTMKNRHYRRQFSTLREHVRRGRSLTDAIAATDLGRLCPLAPVLVSVGEHTGGVDDGLLQVAEDSEALLERRTNLLSKLVEPAVFVVVGGMVGFVYFGFFLAMLAATRSVG
jgi:type II secretory pathway component PulF